MSEDESTLAPPERVTATVALASTIGAATPAKPFRAGDVIDGKYRLDAVLGAGGMGVVFEATHLEIGERVAIKLVVDPTGGERLRREARIALRLKGEHVVRAMDVGTLPSGAPYVVMELLIGQDLSELSRAQGPLPIEDAVDYVLQACEAMAEAHAHGVVHRDLKPSNLFLSRRPDGSPLVKVLDFGIAKAQALTSASGAPLASLTGSTAVLGTPCYMAPEQVRGAKHVDARADVWALGVILHELIAGAPPFRGELPSAVLASIAADPPARLRDARPAAPDALEEAILRCLEKDPERRTPSIGALAAALAPFAPARARITLDRIAGLSAREAARNESTPPAPHANSAVAVSIAIPPTKRQWRHAALLAVAAMVVIFLRARRETRVAATPVPASAAPLATAPIIVQAATGSSAESTPAPRLAWTSAPAPVTTGTRVAPDRSPSLSALPASAPRATVPKPPAVPRRAAPDPGGDVEAAIAQRH